MRSSVDDLPCGTVGGYNGRVLVGPGATLQWIFHVVRVLAVIELVVP